MTPDPNHVVRWSGSRPFDSARVSNIRLWFHDFLKEYLVPPGDLEGVLMSANNFRVGFGTGKLLHSPTRRI